MKKTAVIFKVLLFVILAISLIDGVISYAMAGGYIGAVNYRIMAIVQVALSVVAIIIAIIYTVMRQRRLYGLFEQISFDMSAESGVMENINLPVMKVNNGVVEWYNNAFRTDVLSGKDVIDHPVSEIIPQGISDFISSQIKVEVNNKVYEVFVSGQAEEKMCYFIDRTELKELHYEFDMTRSVVGYITVDNLDDITRGFKDSEKANITSAVEGCIEQWANGFNCIFRKIATDRYFVITDKRGLEYLRNTKFDILRKVRGLNLNQDACATLSIGFGYEGSSFEENNNYASDALDMALGRGGDQVAVKNGNDFEFFGGTTATGSKRSRVRTRVVASSLKKLIEDSSNVIIMGHKNADLDCIGSAYGLSKAVTHLKRPVNIVLNRETCLCSNLIQYLEKETANVFLDVEQAEELIEEDTLLIITDTHRRAFLESPEVYDKCSNVVIIDHHRKTVDYIDNSVIFYHEPYSSSASEMATELVQQIVPRISRSTADALFAGIMLDTRNFVLHTSSRTFEASAYLRMCGANPVNVKNFFQTTVDVFKQKAKFVSSATVYGTSAISYSDKTGTSIRLAASQAADEMLEIDGVDAAFVIFRNEQIMNISARSLGAVNVQLIMEKLGGGGHLTMAAAQLKEATVEETMDKLIQAIDEYNSENS